MIAWKIVLKFVLLKCCVIDGNVYNRRSKEFFNGFVGVEDGLELGGSNYLYGYAGAGYATWGGKTSQNSFDCFGAFSCIDMKFSNESGIPTHVECDAFHSCTNMNITVNYFIQCESGLGCPGTFINMDRDDTFKGSGLSCWGVGSCAYQTGISRGYTHSNIHSDAAFGYYMGNYTTSGTNFSISYVQSDGFASMYGASFRCKGNETCQIDCGASHSCYGLTYICDDEATCLLYGCNLTYVFCPILQGNGTFIYQNGTLIDYNQFEFYEHLEFWIKELADIFIPTLDEIIEINGGTFYDDLCVVNCGNAYCARDEIWSPFDANSINSSWQTGNNQSSVICFSGYQAGYQTEIHFDTNDNGYDIHCDGETSCMYICILPL